jgi:peptidoglycan/xylan/chitin deacetylase (PgdA/CDA1 family)
MFTRRFFAFLGSIALVSFFPAVTPLSPPPASAATNTVVSFTFDDGQATQYSTLPMFSSRGMAGTYYLNSALVGSSSFYMNWSQINDLAGAGAEIGGHTLHHTDLTSVSRSTAVTEVCQDRQNLIARGFSVTSFAYPYASVDSTAESVVAECGYASGRGVGGVRSGNICTDCPWAESVPPVDPMWLQTPEPTASNTTLAQLQAYVTNAENNGGGWIILTIHGVCTSCGSDGLNPATLAAFLDWLGPRAASGTLVRTVGDVMNPGPPGPDTTPPTTFATCNGGSCAGWFNAEPVTVALTATDNTGGSGVDRTRYTTDGSDPLTSPTAVVYTAPFGEVQGQTVRFASIDVAGNAEAPKTLTVRFDFAGPSVSLTQPVEGATLRRNRTVSIQATASDGAGESGVASVAFYRDGTLLGTDTSAPYQRAWTPRTADLGARTLTAVATDVAGNAMTSTAVHVTVVR